MALLGILSLVSLVFGIDAMSNAKSAIHEIVAMLGFAIFAILLSALFILGKLEMIREKIAPEKKEQ